MDWLATVKEVVETLGAIGTTVGIWYKTVKEIRSKKSERQEKETKEEAEKKKDPHPIECESIDK